MVNYFNKSTLAVVRLQQIKLQNSFPSNFGTYLQDNGLIYLAVGGFLAVESPPFNSVQPGRFRLPRLSWDQETFFGVPFQAHKESLIRLAK